MSLGGFYEITFPFVERNVPMPYVCSTGALHAPKENTIPVPASCPAGATGPPPPVWRQRRPRADSPFPVPGPPISGRCPGTRPAGRRRPVPQSSRGLIVSSQRYFKIRISFTNHFQRLLHYFHRTFVHCNSTNIKPSFFFQMLGERGKHRSPHFFISRFTR